MRNRWFQLLAVLLAMSLVGVACGSDDDDADGGGQTETTEAPEDAPEIDFEAVGLWDDGPCDEAREPLVVGLMTAFDSPTLSALDQAQALEASATAFNARGGANGACIEVHNCDDGTNFDQAVACARELVDAGVHATVNDQGTVAQAEVSAAMAEAGIPRVASNVTNADWGDLNAYPIDASGTGYTFMMPNGLLVDDVTDMAVVRIDLPAASVLGGLLTTIYEDEGLSLAADLPVPAGTTDYTQFVLAADDAGAGGLGLALSQQQSLQIIKATQQLGSDLKISGSLGSFTHDDVAGLGDVASQVNFLSPFPPVTFDLPAYEVLRADLAASGEDALQVRSMRGTAMRSWIGLYALLRMIRDADMQEFTREGIKAMLDEATDVPMLGIYGDEAWTPSKAQEGSALWKRPGIGRWGIYRWDPELEWEGEEGNFREVGAVDFYEALCGSPFGPPEPC